MSFGQEEVERRRALREELRQQRQQEQQRLIKRLTYAGVALAVAAVVILVAVLIGSAEGKKPEESTTPTEMTFEDTLPSGEQTVIHFAAAGDLNITDKVVSSGGSVMDYARVIGDVLPLLADADLTTLNFEGNVVGAPYGTQQASAPAQLLNILATAGVDMVQIANSRSIHNGITGLSATLSAIRAAGIEPIGAYATNDEFDDNGGYTVWEVEGVRVGVVAFTKGMDNMALPAGSENCVNVLYKDYSSTYVDVDTDRITSILKRLDREKPDVTIALVHWGSEYNDTHSKTQEKIRDLLLENGVDAILGTHPHYVQKITQDASGRVVAYSLGDLLSDGEKPGTNYSVLLDLEITKNGETGAVSITGYDYIPVFYADEREIGGTARLLRIREAMAAYENNFLDRVSQETYEAMKNALARIEARVKGE